MQFLFYRFESQNYLGWKGALDIIQPNLPSQGSCKGIVIFTCHTYKPRSISTLTKSDTESFYNRKLELENNPISRWWLLAPCNGFIYDHDFITKSKLNKLLPNYLRYEHFWSSPVPPPLDWSLFAQAMMLTKSMPLPALKFSLSSSPKNVWPTCAPPLCRRCLMPRSLKLKCSTNQALRSWFELIADH